MTTLSPWEHAARAFEPPARHWPTPGDLAAHLDPRTVQTPALDLIDAELTRLLDTPDGRLIISMPPQEGKPVIEWAMILMGDGSRKMLADVQVGDTVITHRGRPRRVTAVHEQGVLPIVRITTHAGRVIEAAQDHPFMTPGGWVNAGDLAVGDVLAAVRAPSTDAKPTLSAEAARLLGYFIGDGSTTQSKTTLNADITCVDPDELADIERCVKALGFACTYRPDSKRVKITGGVRPWIRHHGLAGKNSHTKRVPAEIYTQPPEIIAEFIGAYFACDGTVSRRGGARPDARVEFNSVSRDLLADVQHLLLRLGIASTLRAKRTKFKGEPYVSYRLLLRRQDDVARFREAVPFVHAKAKTLAEWPLRRTEFDTAYVADAIESIEHPSPEACRCLTVEEDHTFTAEDVVVHNSTRAAGDFPVWALTQNPNLRIVTASYAQSLANRNGRAIRRRITEHPILGLRLAPDNGAVSDWTLDSHTGGVLSVGIGSGLTGRPADLMVIDDPISNREQADSKVYRDRAWDWWTDVASTRLAPGAPVVLILTRWHHDDLAGRLLAAPDGHLWRVVNIPAQSTGDSDPLGRPEGHYMTSARGRTQEQWDAIKVRVGSRTWASLYQGQPTPDQGNLFPTDKWARYTQPLWVDRGDGTRIVPDAGRDPDVELVQSWDFTFKDTKGSDYVVGQVWLRRGVDAYLLDQVRRRAGFNDSVQMMLDLTARWPQAVAKLVEDKANGPAILNAVRAKVGGLIPVEPEGSKYARAAAITPFVEAGNVWLPDPTAVEGTAWVTDLTDEARDFPAAAHDDTVDAMSQAVHRLLLVPLVDDTLHDATDLIDDDDALDWAANY